MGYDTANVGAILDEYESFEAVRAHARSHDGDVDWADIAESMRSEGAWTSAGAEHVAFLAKQYGSFVLRNALALALALGIEDGELGL